MTTALALAAAASATEIDSAKRHQRHHPTVTSIRDLRHARPESLGQIAADLGVHPNTLARWERGLRIPGPESVNRLADYYGVARQEIVDFFDAHRTPAGPPDTLRATGLRRVRTSRALSVRVLAQKLDVPTHTIYNWERGAARMPSTLLPVLARAIGTDPDVLRRLLAQPAVAAVPAPPHPTQLERWRRRAELTKTAAARLIGCNRQTLGKWESGASSPSLKAIRAIARHYGVRPFDVAQAVEFTPMPKLDPRSWRSNDFQRVVADLRRWSGLTQRDLADRLDIGFATVRAWESGRTEPAPARARQLEQVFNLPHESLERTRRTRRATRDTAPAAPDPRDRLVGTHGGPAHSDPMEDR